MIISGHNINSPYPSYFEINIHCNDFGEILYEELESKIDFKDTLMRIYINYISRTNETILLKLNSKLKSENIESIDEIMDIVENILTNEFSDITIQIQEFISKGIYETSKSIEFIPNYLLCILADEIIRLTAIKQKISSENEYVSMNSHISLMTKAHGFKWVKFDDKII